MRENSSSTDGRLPGQPLTLVNIHL